uniref:SH3 domain-containing protein n=1 Tax=Ciona savignyi TaxID=51511 RepID=H2Z379_CIOSA
MEAIVLKDFIVSFPDEFALKKEMVVKVFSVKQEEEDWYEAEQDGKIGVVPKTHIEITPHEHHDTITREAIALHDFTASAPDELSFKKGSKLTVFKVNQDRDWYKAKQDGKRGNVPKNYINLEPLE